MKFYRVLLPYLIVLLMATSSFADEPEKTETPKRDDGPAFILMPWNMFIGGADGFVVGADWVFCRYNFIYVSPFEWNSLNLPTGLGLWV